MNTKALTWVLLIMCMGPLLAQSNQTGAVKGVVQDAQGAGLPGAVVAVAMADGSYPKSVVTDSDGAFRIGFLRPGAYNLKAVMSGFNTKEIKGLAVGAARIIPVEIKLEAGSVSEALTVVAQDPLIDNTTTEYTTTLSDEQMDRLPVTRTVTDLVSFTAGAGNNQVWGGSTSQANNYQFDGVAVSSPGFGGSFLLPNINWVKEFQVKGLGAGAEYGNFQGGLINIVTKSGSNTFEGDIYAIYESDSINDSNLVAGEDGSETGFFGEVNASVGGAFVKDKLYYFFSVEQQTRDTKVVDLTAPDGVSFLQNEQERTETKLFSKITWQATELDSFNLVLGVDDVETENRGLNSFDLVTSTSTQESPSVLYNLSWERPFGSNHFMEMKLTGYDGENNRNPKFGDISAVRTLGGNRVTGRNAVHTRTQDLSNNGLTLNLDSFYTLGNTVHHIKSGGEYIAGTWNERRIRNGGMTWRPEEGDVPFDHNDPSTWGFISSDWGGNINLDAETTNAAIYIQDYIEVNDRLDLSLGLRYGFWGGDLIPGSGGGAKFEAMSDSALAPRIGATIDLDGKDELVGKVHWGRYYQNMFSLMFDRVAGSEAFGDEEYYDWIGEGLPDLNRTYTRDDLGALFEFFDSTQTSQENGPVENYSQPYVEQLVIGLEKQIGQYWKTTLTYVNRENHDILALVDRNLDTNYTAFNNVGVIDFNSGDPVTDPSGAPLILPEVLVSNADIIDRGWAPGLSDADVAALTFDQDLVLTQAEGAFREFDQIQFQLDRIGPTWDLSLAVVYTDLVGNFFSVSGYDDPDGIGAGSFVNPNEQTNFVGTLRNTAEWDTKLRFTTDLPGDFNLGVFARYDTGQTYTPRYSIDRRNHDFEAADGELFNPRHFSMVNGEAIFLEERGSREFDSFSRIDLHLDKVFHFGQVRLKLAADIFNLFNSDTVTSLKSSVNNQILDDPTSLFGAVRGRQESRIVRFQTALRW